MMMMRRHFAAGALLGGATLLRAAPLRAQAAWPQRPVRLLVGFAPGGFADIVARALAEPMAAALGQPFVVENRTGASGTLASAAAARAPADGSVLLLGHSTPNAVAAALFRDLPYDPVRDFTPIAQVAQHPHMLVVPAASPFRSAADLVAAARAQPGSITYASAGIGSVHHLASAMFAEAAGLDLTHVPYRGSAPAMADLLAGRVAMAIDGVAAVAPQIAEGKLRPLAAATMARIGRFPDLPTLHEQGYGEIDAMSWVGLFGPAGLPDAILSTAAAAVDRAMQAPAVLRMLEDASTIVATRRGAEFGRFVAAEVDRYKAVLGDNQIALQ
ncbi:tripartite tricarboxylate transporter substrate binding protein [Roseomonas hellenica]|uniref:Tripartite tricarboxylate transporter substrate binding protein n=1 Tax=Plastoroseomonas hellenica TaxID=2687306 RepID=A0ABS5ESC2_9PROT|nr:tripartite tricarboxylate transporter substrate-binding protein [Plastoroseomonas hellenica]MBR0663192.1 tripartite tricarboxylate transporter substrate binding protein [Plastoroseomonas hellenica]